MKGRMEVLDSYRIYCNGGRVRMCILSNYARDILNEWVVKEWKSSLGRRINPTPCRVMGCEFTFQAESPELLRELWERDMAVKDRLEKAKKHNCYKKDNWEL